MNPQLFAIFHARANTLVPLLALCILVGACSGITRPQPRESLLAQAQAWGWQARTIPGDIFDLWSMAPESTTPQLTTSQSTTPKPITPAPKTAAPPTHHQLVVYLEGDGLAWRNRYQMSANPTPANPLALGLALIDPAPHVAYLARPCQFVSDANSHGCDGYYWTNGRYSQAVITATSAALDQLKAQAKAQSLVLVGYSGGATVALLVAAQRRDIAQVITVAGNLNPDAWTQLHQVSPLTGSLNPMNYLPQLRQIPQIHFVGMQDTNTPPALAQEFMQQLHQASPEQTSVTQELILLPNYTHDCCWSKDWPARISQARRNTY